MADKLILQARMSFAVGDLAVPMPAGASAHVTPAGASQPRFKLPDVSSKFRLKLATINVVPTPGAGVGPVNILTVAADLVFPNVTGEASSIMLPPYNSNLANAVVPGVDGGDSSFGFLPAEFYGYDFQTSGGQIFGGGLFDVILFNRVLLNNGGVAGLVDFHSVWVVEIWGRG
jgi:hypothetical protein